MKTQKNIEEIISTLTSFRETIRKEYKINRGSYMEQNWIIKAAKKANTPSDLVILEKPDVKKYLDGLLLKRFWPVIHNSLEASDYAYLPEGIPETELEHNVNLSRSLTFMLLDKRFLFFRGKLSCSTDGWMDA